MGCKLKATKYCLKLFTKYIDAPCQFQSLLCGDHSGDSILKFWSHLKTLPDYKYHRVLHSLSDSELKKTVPCCLHGDGAEMFRDDEFWVMNWSSPFGSGGGRSCLVTRYPILLVAERQMTSNQAIWHHMNFRLLGREVSVEFQKTFYSLD